MAQAVEEQKASSVTADLKSLATLLQSEIEKYSQLRENPQFLELVDRVLANLPERTEESVQVVTDQVGDALLELASFFADKNTSESEDLKEVISTFTWFFVTKLRLPGVPRGPQWRAIQKFVSEQAVNVVFYRQGDRGYKKKWKSYANSPNSYPEEDLRPGVIAVVYNVEGIIETLNQEEFADMQFAIRTGGHQYSGYSSTNGGNVQIDMSEAFHRHEYDSNANVLYCGVSQKLQKWAEDNADEEIFLPMGVCSNVHLGGHVHTGGIGVHARGQGFLVDHVLAFTTVLADTRKLLVIRPSFKIDENKALIEEWESNADGFVFDAHLNDDLFFATLGGSAGGDMGIVTEFFFRPVRDIEFPKSCGWSYVWLYTRDRLLSMATKMSDWVALLQTDDHDFPPDFDAMITVFKQPEVAQVDWSQVDLPQVDPDKLPSHKVPSPKVLRLLKWKLKKMKLPSVIILYMSANEHCKAVQDCAQEMIDAGGENAGGENTALVHNFMDERLSFLTQQWVMSSEREYELPYVRGARATSNLLQPEVWATSMTEFTDSIMSLPYKENKLMVATQLQFYGGNGTGIATGDPHGETALPIRDGTLGVTYPVFYEEDNPDARAAAVKIRENMQDTWIGADRVFGAEDYRLFAFTWGERDIDVIQGAYYRDDALYERIRGIKSAVDPNGRLSSGTFSIRGL